MGRAVGRAAQVACWLVAFATAAAADPAPERPGLALRAALAARDAGRTDEALAGFDEVARRWPLVGDHAARLGVETRLAAARAESALEAATAFTQQHASSPLRARVARLRGDAAAALGRGEAAREGWREALAGTRDPLDRATLQLDLARSEQAAGDLQAASQSYLAAWLSAPSSPAAAAAESALAALEQEGKIPGRDASAWSRRGDALFEAGLHADAVSAYDEALAREPAAALRPAILRQRAFALFRGRRYPEAKAAFERLGADAETRFWRARATARSGDLPAAITAFETLGAEGSSYGPRSRLLAATLLQDAADTRERAAAHYAAVAEAARDDELRRDALWRLGWLRYRDGRAEEAEAAFARLADATPDPIGALRARYFAVRARERITGPGTAIRDAFAALAREYPLSYYGWRAALRAEGADLAPRQPAPGSLGTPTLAGPPVTRIEILVEAGLPAEAESEIALLAPSVRSDADRVALAKLAVAAGAPQQAHALISEGRAVELAGVPAPGREALWLLAWPRAFEPLVEAAAAAEGVPADLVFSIMREESSFQPNALSAVGARGLLQLMPETAARMAAELGLEAPHVDALYRPELNIRLGTRLLAGLLRDFSGQQAAAIGGYNAGSAAVTRWLGEAPGLAEDEWVEAIPYDETRAYVRRVMRSLHAYRVLY
jgi:soluble lytic murein transglycosylase